MAGRLQPRLAVALLVPFLGAALPSPAQDFLPAYTAAKLAARGDARSAYLPPNAHSLFDAAPELVRLSLEHGRAVGVERRGVTAFVAPPPALLVTLPFTALSFPLAARLWALLQAAAASLSVWLLFGYVRRDAAFATAALAFAPMAAFVAFAGQSTGFVLLAASAYASPPSRKGDALVAVATALAVVFKLWPALALLGLGLLGRRRAALFAVSLVAALTAATWLALPHQLFGDFFAATNALARVVVPDANNLSFESLTLRGVTGAASSDFVAVKAELRAWLEVLRAAVLGMALAAWLMRRPSTTLVWSAAWTLGLVWLPLSWSHYLVLAPALLAPALYDASLGSSRRYWTLATLASAGPFAFLDRPGALLGAAMLGNLAACVFAACWLSPRRAATPPPR